VNMSTPDAAAFHTSFCLSRTCLQSIPLRIHRKCTHENQETNLLRRLSPTPWRTRSVCFTPARSEDKSIAASNVFSCDSSLYRRDAFAAALAAALAATSACLFLDVETADAEDLHERPKPMDAEFVKTPSGLAYFDYEVGKGPLPQPGQVVVFEYTARLANRFGWRFDGTERGDEPFIATLGEGQLLEGLEEGLLTMHLGGFRRFVIPPELGFKDTKTGPVPRDFGDRRRLYSTVLNTNRPGVTVVYDVRLISIRPAS